MAYKIMYGDELLYDSYTDAWVSEARLTSEINTSGYFDFTIHPDSPLIDKIEEKKDVVKLYFNDEVLFEGFVESISTDIYGSKDVSCASALSYLGWTLVRPYSTDPETSDILRAPTNTDAFFEWVVDQHNKASLYSWMQFGIGINQGGYMTGEVIPFRENTSLPTTADTIEDEVLSYGGYLFLRYEGSNRILDLYSDVHSDNTQIIDFGVNLIDFVKTIGTDDQYTAVRPVGGTPEREEGDEDQTPLPAVTLSSMKDGAVEGETDYIKRGDVVYCDSAVSRYGYREYAYSNNDILDQKLLARYAVADLKRKISPIVNIEVKAVDLALYMEGYSHLQCGQAVRIRSKPHDIDMYLMVSSIDLDLLNPSATTYTLGAVFDTLTGEQSAYLKRMTGQINSAVDQVAAIDQAAKDAAEAAKDAITDSKAEFYQSNSPHELLGGSWVESNVWQQGKYTWTRTLVTYGDGRMEYLPNETGVCISGNTGDKGDPGLAGEPGIDGRTSYFHVKYSPVQNPNAGQMTETPDKFIGTYVDFVKNDSDDPSSYTWTQFRGDPGATGIPGHNGADGKTSYLHIAYADSADGKNGFSVSDSKDKLYIGQYTDFEDQDSTDPGRYSWTKVKGDTGEAGPQGPQGDPGEEGAQGPQGDPGTPGVGISAITEYYLATAASTGVTTSTSGWTTKVQSTDPTKRYLWNYEVTTFSDGSTKITDPVIIGVHGATGADGKGIKSIVEWYLVTSEPTGVTPSTAGWKTTPDATTATNRYLWNYEIVTYTDNTTTQTTPAIIGTHGATGSQGPQGPAGAPGSQGPQGPAGSTGKGLVSVVDEWYVSTSSTSQQGGSWSTDFPTIPSGRYLWHRQRMTWSDKSVTHTNATVSQWVTKTDFQQTTDSIKITAEGALQKVENLDIGGEQLLTGTRDFTAMCAPTSGAATGDSDAYPGFKYITGRMPASSYADPINTGHLSGIPIPKKGDTFTLSFDARCLDGTLRMFCYLYEGANVTVSKTGVTSQGNTRTTADGNVRFDLDPTWRRYWVTWTYNADATRQPMVIAGRLQVGASTGTGSAIGMVRLKLEKGNVATDWSPSPADNDVKYSTKAELKVQADRITGVVSDTSKLGDRVSTVEQKSDSFEIRFDNLQVGGTNLAEHTDDLENPYYWGFANSPTITFGGGSDASLPNGRYVSLTMAVANGTAYDGGPYINGGTVGYPSKLIKGETYTVSYWAKFSRNVVSNGRLLCEFLNPAAPVTAPLLSTEWQRYVFTGTAPATAPTAQRAIVFYLGDEWKNGDVLYVSSLKVEKGNMATDWSPAPEDVDADIDDAAKTATNFLRMDSGGLTVGDLRTSTTGKNVHIDQDSVDIRNGSTVLATFEAERIGLGMNSTNAGVEFIGGKGRMEYYTGSGLTLAGDTGIDLRIKGATERNPYVTLVNKGTAASPSYYLALSADTVSLFDTHAAQGGVYDVQFSKPAYHLINLLNRFDTEWYQTKFASNLNALWNSGLFYWTPTTVGIPEANTYGMGICISNQQVNSASNWTYQFAKTTVDTSRLWVRQSINTGGWTTWKLVGDAQSDTGWRKLAGTYDTPVGHDGTNGLYYRKTGPMVTVYVNGGGDWGPAITTGGTVIGTLPTGYRPNCMMNYPLGFKGANTHRLEIFPNGQLKGILQTSNPTRYYVATAVFPV